MTMKSGTFPQYAIF